MFINNQRRSVGQQLFKSTLVVSSLTLLSRLLGFVRDMLIARLFGVDWTTDAFFVAFKLPNFLRRLFTEGAFAHAFVPVMAGYQAQSDKSALQAFIDKSAGSLAWCLFMLSLLGVLIAPLLILLLAPGFAWSGEQHDLSVVLLRITLPYLFFIGMVAFAGSVLNAHSRFAIPALTPVFLNLCMIGAAVWLAPHLAQPVEALAWGVFLAGVVQLLIQLPALYRLGLLPRCRIDFQDEGVKRVLQQLLPAIFSTSVTQINLLLDTLFASFLSVGSVSWLYYSDRLVEFPLGLLGLTLGTVILPNLAKHHADAKPEDFSRALDWGLRWVLLIGLPATVGLVVLAEPMLSTLFQYKEFDSYDVQMAGRSVRAYALGLLAYIFIKVLVAGFTARQDMKTPVRYGIYAMLLSLVLNGVLIVPLAHAGLALATSLGAFFNALLLFIKLCKIGIYQPAANGRIFLLRILFANALMCAVLYYGVQPEQWAMWSATERVLQLALWIALGMTVYGLSLLLSGLRTKDLIID